MAGVSVTPAFLSRVDKIIFIVTGAEKQEMVRALLEFPYSIPVGQAVADVPELHIWADETAAVRS